MPLIDVTGVGPVNMVRSAERSQSPVVLLHPVGLDLTWWNPQFDWFSETRELIAFDMPGHGASARPPDGPSFELLVATLKGVIQATGGRPAHLVGLSVGGMIAQLFAIRHPAMVRSLTLVATLCTFADDVRAALRTRAEVARTDGMTRIAQLSNERWFTAAFRKKRPDLVDRVNKSLTLQPGDFHGAMWDMISRLDLVGDLPRIGRPTLVVVGGEDGNAPIAAGQTIASSIPNAALKVMPGLGHFPPFEAPDAFNRILESFLSAQEKTSRDC